MPKSVKARLFVLGVFLIGLAGIFTSVLNDEPVLWQSRADPSFDADAFRYLHRNRPLAIKVLAPGHWGNSRQLSAVVSSALDGLPLLDGMKITFPDEGAPNPPSRLVINLLVDHGVSGDEICSNDGDMKSVDTAVSLIMAYCRNGSAKGTVKGKLKEISSLEDPRMVRLLRQAFTQLIPDTAAKGNRD